ncbi:3429_t:CDS:10 [Ambispora gerdemannii]|uniref:3429_t:CDS:1 n=1 Tax=Ambispora gerdemannii TaxID=144530 RepID=A0A9N8YP39_9GLOM|nr:3429_t:CDS:10 [Ambispora gerdemannii]
MSDFLEDEYNQSDDDEMDLVEEAEDELSNEHKSSSRQRRSDNRDNDKIKREEHEEMKKAYLREACLALGSREKTLLDDGQIEDVYVIGDLYALRNIIELIRVDRPLVITYLSNLNTLEKDLFPIVTLNRKISNKNEKNLTYGCVDLFIQMTESLQGDDNLLEEDMINEDTIVEQKTRQLAAQEAQQRFKELFIRNPIALEIVRDLLCENLEQEKWKRTREERTEARNIIGCCLFFFRNLTGIQEPVTLLDNTHRLQSQLIVLFHEKEILHLLVDIASNRKKMEDWYYLVQEIFYFIFFGIRPKDIFVDLSKKDEQPDPLKLLLEKEVADAKKYSMMRHSRWGGSHTMKLSGFTFTVHGQKPSLDPGPQLPDRGKKKFQKTKILDEFDKIKNLTPIALRLLKETATDLIDYGGLNEMIFYVKKGIEHQKAEIHPNDHVKLLYMIRFFIEMELLLINESRKPLPLLNPQEPSMPYNYNRNHSNIENTLLLSPLSSPPPLRQINFNLSWSDLHYAVECFLHMLNYIQEMTKSLLSEDKNDANALLSEIFSEATTFDMILGISKSIISLFHRQLPSNRYLQSVIEMIDVFFLLLEQYLAASHLYTRKKRVARKKKKTKSKKGKKTTEGTATVNSKDENGETADHKAETVKCRGVGLFFKLSTLEIFNRTLIRLQKLSKSPAHLDLEDFIKFCVRQFIKAAKSDPSLFASVLLPKRRSDYILSSEENTLPNSNGKNSVEASEFNVECSNRQEQTTQSNAEASGGQEHNAEQSNTEPTEKEGQNIHSNIESSGGQVQDKEVDPEQENELQSNSNNVDSTRLEREIETKSREPLWKRYSKKTKHTTGSIPANKDNYDSDSNVIVGGSSKSSTIESSPNNLDSNLRQRQSTRTNGGDYDDNDEDDNYEFTVNLAPIVKDTDYEDEDATRVVMNSLSSSSAVASSASANKSVIDETESIDDVEPIDLYFENSDIDNELSMNSIIKKFKDSEKLKSMYIEDEAEESEDEYKGMGGSDKEDDDNDVGELIGFINNDMSKENTDSLDVQNLFQQQILEEDQAEVSRIQRDLEKGRIGKRRRNNIGDDDDDDEAFMKAGIENNTSIFDEINIHGGDPSSTSFFNTFPETSGDNSGSSSSNLFDDIFKDDFNNIDQSIVEEIIVERNNEEDDVDVSMQGILFSEIFSS